MPAKAKKKTDSVGALAARVADTSVLFNNDDSPFRAAVAPGAPKLVVVTGENASGKSLFVRVAASMAQLDGALPVTVSIRERTGAGTNEMSGFRRVMMFGEEQEQSTGATSVKVVDTAFNQLDRKQGSLLVLDEPELGLSDAYARAFGEHLAAQVKDIPRVCAGVVVVTHSRSLAQGLLDGCTKTPTHAAVVAEREPEPGLERWIAEPERRTVEELLSLPDTGLERWRTVNGLLKS